MRRLAAIGIATLEDLRRVGAVAADIRMRFHQPAGLSRNALHALGAALRGCDWRDRDPAVKERLNAAVDEALRRRDGRE